MQYDDGTYELMEQKFYNSEKGEPKIVNGITEMIFTNEGEKLKIIFIDQLKPKQKGFKTVTIPDDL